MAFSKQACTYSQFGQANTHKCDPYLSCHYFHGLKLIKIQTKFFQSNLQAVQAFF